MSRNLRAGDPMSGSGDAMQLTRPIASLGVLDVISLISRLTRMELSIMYLESYPEP